MSPLVASPDIVASYTRERALIDGKILALKAQLRDLFQERNTVAPVGRMLPELLVQVFSYLRREWSVGGKNGKVPLTLKLTHVSRHWRAVALNCPALWNEISFRNERLVTEWLKRSYPSNLYVSIDASKRSVLQQIYGQLHRIRHLQVTVASEQALSPFPDTPAPVLSSMSIHNTGLHPFYSLSLPSSKFPALSNLSIKSCHVLNLDSTISTRITSLRVINSPITITLPAILDFLEKMPQLQSIELGTVSLSRNALPKRLRLVGLPHIEVFEYKGTQGDLDFLLLSQLRFSQASPSLRFSTDIPSPLSNLSAMFTAIGTVWRSIVPIHEFELCFEGRDKLTFQANENVVIEIKSSAAAEIYSRCISWMSQNASLFVELQKIRVSGTIQPGLWPFLTKLDGLRSISMKSDQSQQLIRLLIENWNNRKAVGSSRGAGGGRRTRYDQSPFIFPALQSVDLEHANLLGIFQDMRSALQDRSDNGKAIKDLTLLNCICPGIDLMSYLRHVVGKVDVKWDEEDSDDEGDEDSDEDGKTVFHCQDCGDVLTCTLCDAYGED